MRHLFALLVAASFAFTAKSEGPNVEPVPLRWHVIAPADQPAVTPVSDTE